MYLELPDEAATQALGRQLAPVMQEGIVYLEGELGAGKTALARAILQARGYAGKVKSPTYTLVEPYSIDDGTVYHLDLYRLSDPEELEWLGLRDMLGGRVLMLVEWPERGAGVLPPPDLVIALAHQGDGRTVNLRPVSALGHQMLGVLNPDDPVC